ncbi:hypothetical protein [Streptomyces sp. NBC_01614]|uniref:hypothetical protein n=1 Tax=Streptomyces sp. NBC_01614 TaxID=2975897 RepID=UPI00386ADD4C
MTAALIGGGAALAAKGDGGDESIADPAACRTALAKNLREATAAGPDASPLPAPPACLGLDEATLERITGEVISEYWESPEAEKVVEDAWREAWESAFPSP